MKVVGENVKFIIIKTELRVRVAARKAPLYESAQQFRLLKDIETLCNHFSRNVEGKWYVIFANKKDVLLASIMCP